MFLLQNISSNKGLSPCHDDEERKKKESCQESNLVLKMKGENKAITMAQYHTTIYVNLFRSLIFSILLQQWLYSMGAFNYHGYRTVSTSSLLWLRLTSVDTSEM